MSARHRPASLAMPSSVAPWDKAVLEGPTGLVFTPRGLLVVADQMTHRIWAFAAGLPAVLLAGTGRAGRSGEGGPARLCQLDSPQALRCDETGRLFILERSPRGARVRVIEADGTIHTAYTAPPCVHLLDLAVTAAGDLYIAVAQPGGAGPQVIAAPGGPRVRTVFQGAPGSPTELAIAATPTGELFALHGRSLWQLMPGGPRLAVELSQAPSYADTSCLAADAHGHLVLTLAEEGLVLRIDPHTGAIERLASEPGWACQCSGDCVHCPGFPAPTPAGEVYLVDGVVNRIKRLSPYAA